MKFCMYGVAQALEMNPEVAHSVVRDGHEMASHAYRWIDYYGMDEATEKDWINKAIDSITKLTGQPPGGWYYGRMTPKSRRLVWGRVQGTWYSIGLQC